MRGEDELALENRKRLGRGLDALLGPVSAPAEERAPATQRETGRRTVPIALIERNPRNPRREFRAEELDELATSLKQHGIVQPLVVRPVPGDEERYEIIAGERRWRAAQRAGLHEVPVTILDVSDREALELAIVENVQRSDLNPIEEARGYEALIEEFGYSQGDLGDIIGKSRVHVTNTLRLLKLPEPVLAMMQSGAISAGHGRALLGAHDPQKLARMVVERKLSVRDTELLAQLPDAPSGSRPERRKSKNPDIIALEKALTDTMGMRVEIKERGEGRGQVVIQYRSLEQLEAICAALQMPL
jgi:ParB family chromosome partitioning protein